MVKFPAKSQFPAKFYFCHPESESAWFKTCHSEQEVDNELQEPLVELITKDQFDELEINNWDVFDGDKND